MAQCCTGCGLEQPSKPTSMTWWSLRNYFGLSGWFCPECYDMVSHNSYKQPNNPAAYIMMLLKRGVKNV